MFSFWLVQEDKSVRLKRLNATSAEQRFNKENPSDSPSEMRKWPKIATRGSFGEYSPKVSFKRNNRLSVKGSFFDLLTDGEGRARRSGSRRRRSHDGRTSATDFLNANGYIQNRTDETTESKEEHQPESNPLPHIVVDTSGESEAAESPKETDSLMQKSPNTPNSPVSPNSPKAVVSENKRTKPSAPVLSNSPTCEYQQVPSCPDRLYPMLEMGLIGSEQETFM